MAWSNVFAVSCLSSGGVPFESTGRGDEVTKSNKLDRNREIGRSRGKSMSNLCRQEARVKILADLIVTTKAQTERTGPFDIPSKCCRDR
jgi:hypothetical protein